ncbi:zinc finger protein ZAT1-like [Lolium rigidum]|uniref:zinc finger protein ZAT1-like n=1 Tax=Lolium rigidum TaxID=89674 RepID=UPI001F5C1FF0|nr:zinc finger protein ZAT1-like [Lolium rigidum]
MAKNTCKLCARRFASPRALSGHMRSHSLAAAAARSQQISSASSSVAAGDDDADAKMAVQAYVLREKPKRRVRLGESDGFSDRESDAEYPPPQSPGAKKRRAHAGSGDAAEPVSSLSDAATPEEDVARSLMMLSRDTWPAAPAAATAWPYYYYSDDDEGSDGGGGARAVARAAAPRRTEFQCPACKKVFRSYQALGGHRASHVRGGRGGCCAPPLNPPPRAVSTHLQPLPECDGAGGEDGSKAPHVCQYCSRAFPSGKALGGHKRSQLCSAAAVAAASGADPAAAIEGLDLIDLNLPVRWDDVVELSAVSDPLLSSKSPGS